MSVEELQKRIEELQKESDEYQTLFEQAREILDNVNQDFSVCMGVKCLEMFDKEDEEKCYRIGSLYFCLECAKKEDGYEENKSDDESDKDAAICEDCKEIVDDSGCCPSTCYECDKIYHFNCCRGNIRYIENECEDYCYKCKDYGASDCEDSDSESEEEEKNINKMTVKELKALCKSKGIKGYSKLKKQQLLDLLKPKEEVEEEEKMLCQYCEESVNRDDIRYIMILGYGCDYICVGCIEKHHEQCKNCSNIRRNGEAIDYDDFCDSCRHWNGKDCEESEEEEEENLCENCEKELDKDTFAHCGHHFCSGKMCEDCHHEALDKQYEEATEELLKFLNELREKYEEYKKEETDEEKLTNKLKELCEEYNFELTDYQDANVLDENYIYDEGIEIDEDPWCNNH